VLSTVQLGIWRVENGLQTRFETSVVRDYKTKPVDFSNMIKQDRAEEAAATKSATNTSLIPTQRNGKSSNSGSVSFVLLLLVLLVALGASFATLYFRKNCAALGIASTAGWIVKGSADSELIMISYLEKAINDMSASLSNASEAVAKNNSKLEMISWARSQRAQPTFPTLPLNASASKSILQSNESAKHNTTATNDSATESIMQRYNSTEQSRYKLRSHVDNISSALTLDIATPKNESESVSQSYNSTEQSWYEVGGHFDNMTSALTLGISAAKNATRAIRVLHAEKKELNIRGQQLATEAVLLLEKVSRLELELDVETLARTTCEATLSNTKANLTKTWTLLQEDSAELKLEKEGHAGICYFMCGCVCVGVYVCVYVYIYKYISN